MDSPAFDFVCGQLEARSSLDRLEARGTVRLALKSSGLEPGTVSPDQMKVVCEKVLPAEITNRGVADADSICSALAREVLSVEMGEAKDGPDAVFARLGGS